MITGLSHTGIFVLDQDSAKTFYTEKLGFTLNTDVAMGEEFEGAGGGFRWLTVSPPNQPQLEIILADPAMGHDEQTAKQIRELVAKGAIGSGVWNTEDVAKTYAELKERGVEFIQEPTQRPYGVEALFRDDSGNWFSLTERTA
ncbi:MAG TPA: VOC family protein [Pseudonocardiaceae bacterium]|jgi:catechol 2,3-dioxygenase-like lactoylglutathione lyase family enzyme|nr:VOC family protein [Pseudonocardiaceae bacterium]